MRTIVALSYGGLLNLFLSRPRPFAKTSGQMAATFNAMIVSSGGNLCWGQKMMGHSSLKNITEEHFSYITNMSHQDGKKYLEEYEKKVEKCLTGNAE